MIGFQERVEVKAEFGWDEMEWNGPVAMQRLLHGKDA